MRKERGYVIVIFSYLLSDCDLKIFLYLVTGCCIEERKEQVLGRGLQQNQQKGIASSGRLETC